MVMHLARKHTEKGRQGRKKGGRVHRTRRGQSVVDYCRPKVPTFSKPGERMLQSAGLINATLISRAMSDARFADN